MPYTRKQQHYISHFIQHVERVLSFLGTDEANTLDKALGMAEQGVNTATTVLGSVTTILNVMGVVAAVPSGGLSLPAAGAVIACCSWGMRVINLCKSSVTGKRRDRYLRMS